MIIHSFPKRVWLGRVEWIPGYSHALAQCASFQFQLDRGTFCHLAEELGSLIGFKRFDRSTDPRRLAPAITMRDFSFRRAYPPGGIKSSWLSSRLFDDGLFHSLQLTPESGKSAKPWPKLRWLLSPAFFGLMFNANCTACLIA